MFPARVLKSARAHADYLPQKGRWFVRKPSTSYNRTIVRLSVPVDVPTHAKLRAISALRGVDASALAASFIKAALASVVVRDVPAQGETPDTEAMSRGL